MGLMILLITLLYLYKEGISNNEIITKITFYFVVTIERYLHSAEY